MAGVFFDTAYAAGREKPAARTAGVAAVDKGTKLETASDSLSYAAGVVRTTA